MCLNLNIIKLKPGPNDVSVNPRTWFLLNINLLMPKIALIQ